MWRAQDVGAAGVGGVERAAGREVGGGAAGDGQLTRVVVGGPTGLTSSRWMWLSQALAGMQAW